METLVYLSEIIPNTHSAQTIVDGILKQAVKNNPQFEITGALFFHNNVFLQILEGPEKNLQTLLETIQKDRRHKNFKIIYQSEIEKRCFPNWQMQFFNLNNEISFSPDTIQRIQQIYQLNLKFNARDFIELLQASLNDDDFLKEIKQ